MFYTIELSPTRMEPILVQAIIPFVLSALIVIIITVVAEKFGTKLGGILGTLPSTIVVAFIFIYINRGIDFAAQSVAVVPAEMGINILFLFFFTLLINRGIQTATIISLLIWAMMSAVLFLIDLQDIFISILIYTLSLAVSFSILENVKKIQSK